MAPTIVFICGAHCAGKTSILSALVNQKILEDKGYEIGKDLYYKRKFETSKQDANFEFEVAKKELIRDYEYFKENKIIGIETWHPGNIAYATVRNPANVQQLIELAKTSPLIEKAYGIWLRIPPNTIKERTKTFENNAEWASDFYTNIDQNLEYVLKSLNLLERTTIIDASDSFDNVLKKVTKSIKELSAAVI